ncbi:HECT-domain-containing protein [Clavulina sp. PMI_390]|nr:HECT-domain-containing protein [Clavulina sp. PMI_390]
MVVVGGRVPMNQSFFPDSGKSRRAINLGGASSTTSHDTILEGVKARREERLNAVKRSESAVKIQAWYRGRAQSRQVREQLRAQFDTGCSGNLLQWTRCLVVSWSGGPDDEQRLARWSTLVGSNNNLVTPFSGTDREAWNVLLRQVSLLLLKSVALAPQNSESLSHLTLLTSLLDSKGFEAALPRVGSSLSADFCQYLLHRGFYSHIFSALTRIPIEAKTTPTIPLLITLGTQPLQILSPTSPHYQFALTQFVTNILTIPLLPNRLPATTLTFLASNLPFDPLSSLDLPALVSSMTANETSTAEQQLNSHLARVNLLANLLIFASARLPKASAQTLNMYLKLLTLLMDSLPIGCLEAAKAADAQGSWTTADSSDSDSDGPGPSRPAARKAGPSHPVLDTKTYTRLNTLHAPTHINTLLTRTERHVQTRVPLFNFMNSLWIVWPSKRDRVMSTVLNVGGGSGGSRLIKEVWREHIRRSRLGKEEDPKVAVEMFTDPSMTDAWPAFLFLTDIYTHTLLTMGDDEFFSSSFGSSHHSGSTSTHVNPLTLDELTSFSRQLLNVAFPLYWHEDQANVKDGIVPGMKGVTWENVRDKVTACLQAIHARDSRRPFTPPDHWLITSQIDLGSFVSAVLAEERNLNDDPTGGSRMDLDDPMELLRSSRFPRAGFGSSRRVLSKREMAFISPRLGILNNIPFAIPFNTRVEIFQQFIANDAHNRGLDDFFGRAKHKATIRRNNVAKDGFDQLGRLGAGLKDRVAITFIDEWGNEEAGIDGGGVFKEFVTSLTKEVFDTNRGLWSATARQELYPASHSYAKEPHQLEWYRFIGRVLGKALYEGILIDWLGKQSYLDDLQSLDPELYQGLVFLKHYDGKVEDLSLNFTVTREEFGVTKSIDLIANGSNTPVTQENRIRYIFLVAHYHLNTQIKKQSEALFEGVSDMIDPKWLRMFNQKELQILIGGVEEPVDIDDLQQNCIYGGVYDPDHVVIRRFWKVAKSLDQKQRSQLLRFVTSCSRPPLLGFKELNPRFSIRDAGLDDSRLPTSSTCVNLLKLPQYSSEAGLRQKLIQAITSNAGFDLS